jgi:hypothetical protein
MNYSTIVRIGGLGKSTLAEAIIADKRVLRCPWVHVSREFDLLKIGKAIIKIISSSGPGGKVHERAEGQRGFGTQQRRDSSYELLLCCYGGLRSIAIVP